MVPLLLADHIVLWESFLGVSLPSISAGLADFLTRNWNLGLARGPVQGQVELVGEHDRVADPQQLVAEHPLAVDDGGVGRGQGHDLKPGGKPDPVGGDVF